MTAYSCLMQSCGGASRRRGFLRYAESHLECTKANSHRPSLPPLGEVPRSGKGGVVGIFELLPFNEPHPRSQPLRAASSPIGEPRGILRIRLRFHKAADAYRETPLRLAKSRLTAVARLHGACGRTSQALWACPFPFQGRQEWLRIGILVSHVDKRVEMLYIIFDCIFQIKIQKRIGEDRCIWTITSAGGPRSWRMRR